MDTILVIDDEKPTLTMFRFLLEAHGYRVLTAENGWEGIGLFERERPAMVLTDIKMPGMDGIEVLRRIKEIDPKTEVIVITGHGDMDLAIKALDLAAADFINKPIQRHVLEQALQRANERIALMKSRENQVSVEVLETSVLLHLRGSITANAEVQLQEAFHQALCAGRQRIILRFDENVSVNGSGFAVLTRLLLDAGKQERKMFMTGLSENFKKVFQVVGITRLAEVLEAESE